MRKGFLRATAIADDGDGDGDGDGDDDGVMVKETLDGTSSLCSTQKQRRMLRVWNLPDSH